MVTLLLVTCGPQLPAPGAAIPTGPPTSFVIPTVLSNGRVEIAIRTAYAIGTSATIPVRVIAGRGTVTGPTAARILASGIGGGGRPSEALVATLKVAPVAARAGQTLATSVSWDGRDDKGVLVPPDAYSLLLDFRIDDGSLATTANAGATLQWNVP